ncbi:mechanosensitive ion channel domain-containing protein [Mesorhizobium sp.]
MDSSHHDAFLSGDFIEPSGTKGTAEKISIRSATLRNSRG